MKLWRNWDLRLPFPGNPPDGDADGGRPFAASGLLLPEPAWPTLLVSTPFGFILSSHQVSLPGGLCAA